jgi:hypothetical protein
MFGEEPIFCPETYYGYDSKEKQGNILYSHPFEVRGNKNQPVTYWFSAFVGFDMLYTGPGLRVFLMRESNENTQTCLIDKSCIQGIMVSSGRLKLDGILTTGKYKILIETSQSDSLRHLET